MKLILGIVAAVGLLVSGIFGMVLSNQPSHPNQPILAGGFAPSGGGTYRLGQSVGTSDTSIKLSAFKEPISNIPYTMAYLNSTVGYGTISPQSTISEFISFTGITQNTDGSALLTGVTRGLSRTPAGSSCVASTTLATSHAGQSIFILSDSPCLFAEYAVRQNNEWITGTWGFGALPTTTVACTVSTQFCNKAYIDGLSIQGAATSSETNMGIVQLANASQVGSSTASSTEGRPLVIPNKYATTTPSVVCNGISCIVAAISGKIAQTWIDLTQSFTFSGSINSTATTTLAGSSITNNAVVINGKPYSFQSGAAASSTVLANNGSGVTTWVPTDGHLISSSTITAAVASTTVSIAATSTADLRIIIELPTVGANYAISSQFNTDVGANYASSASASWSATPTNNTSVTAMNLIPSQFGFGSTPGYLILDIVNAPNQAKQINWRGCICSITTLNIVNGFGIYGSNNYISSITLGSSSNIPVGTKIRVYGSAQ